MLLRWRIHFGVKLMSREQSCTTNGAATARLAGLRDTCIHTNIRTA